MSGQEYECFCFLGPAVLDGVVWLCDRERQRLHVRGVQTHLLSFHSQSHQDQARLLSARHHLTILRHHQPVPVYQPVV